MTDTVVNLPAPVPARREIQNVVDAVPILDTARFEHMQRVARVMASSSMIPETLRTVGKGTDKVDLPFEQVLSNCFLVVNQAARWGMDPFAVISCCAVVHGRLAYEGKLVAAVLAAKMNISLNHYFTGEPTSDGYRIYLCDQPFTEPLIAQIRPGVKIPGVRLWDGSVGEWKTTGTGTPWTPKNYPRMLIYRGSRDWTRIYEPALMLGVYSDDEMLDLVEDARARRATPVSGLSLVDRLTAAKLLGGITDGFSQDHVARETSGSNTEAQREAADRQLPPASAGDEPLASEQEPESSGVGEVAASELASPSNSSQAHISPDAETDKPATEESPLTEVAGDQSELSAAPPEPGNVEARAGDLGGDTGPQPTLPQGWEITYAAALRRAQKKESLSRFATEYWKQYQGWDTHKAGPNGPTAIAIFDAFANNFGNRDAIDDVLRELI